ncbi:Major facilitator superfamily domain general substrate transporter [Penicillium coprophilum]|uniref:Major facilitator superfamily domain general substrate transporter n=1 Tax=Penicillium coprophilum TaxID=36646 RepID=UPI002388082A|nr:Major facilitator superfamily domain general substrate transporter [Penicillium coprophilum]KAJ5163357.1 Major facilitator superfamily domain general substrate transporter [Penicillium coprophilum]
MGNEDNTPGHTRASTEKGPQQCYPSTPASISRHNSQVSLPPKEANSEPQDEAYSIFSKREKHLAVFLITFAATFSPLSSFIFFPAINALSASLNVSVEKINLTVTSYMIVAGVAPAIIGDLADMTGRRNVYLLTLLIYAVANIGLAVQNSWIALFLLRMMQSAGGSATIAMGYGVISDIASPSERGGYVGMVLLGHTITLLFGSPNIATAIGPILGGALSEAPGWRWIFWVPAIASGICIMLVALFLPETARSIVGNGSRNVSALYRPILGCQRSIKPTSLPALTERENTPRNFRIPNPLTTLKILASRESLLITAIYGVYYMNFSCLQGSLSTLFIDIYHFSELKAGLIYLPFGIGSCIGAYCSGKIMNRDYRLTARAHNLVIDTTHGDDLTAFPIEKARFRSIWYSICATGISTTGYGWALQCRSVSNPNFAEYGTWLMLIEPFHTQHIAVPLVLQFIIGFAIAITFNASCCGTLLTDLNPKSPAAAQAANNIVRCSLAGAGLAFLQSCLDAMGPGWTFTLFGGLCMACLGVSWLEWKYGKMWRQQ